MLLSRVVVVGATGNVGSEILRCLPSSSLKYDSILLVASSRSGGRVLSFAGQDHLVESLDDVVFQEGDLVLSSPGASVSSQYVPRAILAGAIVVDNTSYFRMKPDVPLVIPSVNGDALVHHHGIIANPNCSTIQMLMALHPLHQAFGIRQIVVSTYQSVSGAGYKGIHALEQELAGSSLEHSVFPCDIAMNVIPHIDSFVQGGRTREEQKMEEETHKIFSASFPVIATCVRVPVLVGHAESVYVEFLSDCSEEEVLALLTQAPWVHVMSGSGYMTPKQCAGTDEVYVGRIRMHNSKALSLWIVADNVRTGAALNAIRIAEALMKS